jgi:hypothetical protein
MNVSRETSNEARWRQGGHIRVSANEQGEVIVELPSEHNKILALTPANAKIFAGMLGFFAEKASKKIGMKAMVATA